ncbi:TPA: hypothetical protein ACH3X1_012384 [Trebouxia sp. C0004]
MLQRLRLCFTPCSRADWSTAASEDLDGDFDIQDHFGPNPQADDMMRELEQEEVDGPWTEPRVRSARWFALRKDQAIYEGATLTVRQACFLFLDLKRKCRIRDVALDMLMRVLADVVLPQRNILPSSLYMVERVLQSRPPDSLCYHACPNDDFVWPQLKRSRWSDHTDDHCPECGSSRFQIETAAGTPCLLPMKIQYGQQEEVSPKMNSPGSLYGGTMCQSINAECGGRLMHQDSGGCAIGFDFCQIFNFKTHSSGLMFLRSLDLSEQIKGKIEFCKTLMVLPGPKEPKSFQACFTLVCNDFHKYGPQGDGLLVHESTVDTNGSVQKRTFNHTVFLLSISADSLARQKMAMWPPSGAYLACGWCLFEGYKREGDGGMRFNGYAKPAKQHLLGLQDCKVGDACLQVPDALQHERGRQVAAGQHLPESMLSYNLHFLVCRLKKQEEAKGCVARCGELWVEMGIQDVKSNVKYRTTSCPEKLYVHDLMRDEALLEMQHDDCIHACVRTAVKTFDELVPEYRANIRAGPLYDLGDIGTGTQLIGKGNTLKGDAHSEALQFVAKYVDRMGHSQWAELSTDFTQEEQVKGVFYGKLRFITRTGGEQLFIAEILHFLRAINPDGNVLRLAVCKVYAARYRSSSTDIMSASLNMPKTLAVEVSELDTKLVTVKEGNTLYGMVYSNTSGMA